MTHETRAALNDIRKRDQALGEVATASEAKVDRSVQIDHSVGQLGEIGASSATGKPLRHGRTRRHRVPPYQVLLPYCLSKTATIS